MVKSGDSRGVFVVASSADTDETIDPVDNSCRARDSFTRFARDMIEGVVADAMTVLESGGEREKSYEDATRAKKFAKELKDIGIGDSTAYVRPESRIVDLEEQVKRVVLKVNSLRFDDAETTRFIVCDGHGDVRADGSHFGAELGDLESAKTQKQATEKISVQLLRGIIEELEANRSSDVAALPSGNKERVAAWEETEEKFVLSVDGLLEIAAAFYETASYPDGRQILEAGTATENLQTIVRDVETIPVTIEPVIEELPLRSRSSRNSAESFDGATTLEELGTLARESDETVTENRDAVAEKFQKFLERSQETCEVMKCRSRDILDGRCEEYSDWCSVGPIAGDGFVEGREIAAGKESSADTATTRCDPATSNIQQDIGDGVTATDDAVVFERYTEETNNGDRSGTSAFPTTDKKPKNSKGSFERRIKQFFSKIIRKKNL